MSTKLYQWGMEEKFGEESQWLNDVCDFSDIATAPLDVRSVLFWHGPPNRELIEAVAIRHALYVVMVNTGGTPASWLDRFNTGKDRVHPLSYSVPSLSSWDRQAPWIRRRFTDFMKSIRVYSEALPQWELLEPPPVPEHVIACLLCALGRIEPDVEWRTAFEDEVDWKSQGRGTPTLTWDAHRKDAVALREFLSGW